MNDDRFDQQKIRLLEQALNNYVERYGLSQSAREALEQLEDIQSRRLRVVK